MAISSLYSARVSNAVTYMQARLGSSIIYKRIKTKGSWSPTAFTTIWWEWVPATAIIIDLTTEDLERFGGRLMVGDKSFIILSSIFTDLSNSKYITFNSGSLEFVAGEVLTGATSGATGTVLSWYETSGTWAGGNASGVVYLSSAGSFTGTENINGEGAGRTNIATATAVPVSSGTDYPVPKPGDEIVFNGITYSVEIEGTDPAIKKGTIIMQDATQKTHTVWGRVKNVA